MGEIQFVPFYHHNTVYYFTLLVLVWFTVLYYIGSQGQKLLKSEGSPTQGAALFLALLVTWYIGLRPVSRIFGDMPLYNMNYEAREPGMFAPISIHTEWLWDNIGAFCKTIGLTNNEFFLFVEAIYIGGMFIGAWLLTRKNLWMAMMFFLTSFSFYTYGTNGIRNGAACSVEIVALCLVAEQGAKRVWGFILMFLALGIHRTTMLPSAAAIATLYVIKDTKVAFRLWLVSIPISLTMGPLVEQFFAALGFDDRMSTYYKGQFNEKTASAFSSTGFRWDFLLYGAAPVVMIWYVTRKRKFTDLTYTVLANVYLLCNAFWIMVIRASFSNRFAYLSWFIYPVVVFYPLLRMNIWKTQDRNTAIILFFCSGFLFYMYFIYYFGTTGFKGFDLYWWRK